MPIDRMDHFTILTTNTEETVAFYYDVLGLTPGPRPDFSFPGAWLYNGGKAILHVVEKAVIPEGGGVLDHIAFWGSDIPAYLAKLKAQGVKKGQIPLVSMDGGQESYRRIADPDSALVATVAIPFEEMGIKAVDAVNAIVVKKQPVSSVANGRYLFMDAVLVDAGNVKLFLK